MAIEKYICDGCPAAFALTEYASEDLDNQRDFLSIARLNESKKAGSTLEIAAKMTECKELDKLLPDIPDVVPPVGSEELIELISQCPSFGKYLELRYLETEE